MQKKRWIILGALVWLGACSATDVNYSDKARLSQVKQICIRDNYETRLPGLSEAFAASFEKHRIQTKVIKSMQAEAYASCQYILNGNVRARAGVINRGKFTLLANDAERRYPLSSMAYLRRGAEKEMALSQGPQGQTDRISIILLDKKQ